MTLLDLPHGKTQINESRNFNGKVDESTISKERRGGGRRDLWGEVISPLEKPIPYFSSSRQTQRRCQRQRLGGGGARKSTSLLGTEMPGVPSQPGIEKTDKFKPTTSRTPALHLQFYSSVSVWRGTEGGGVDAHRKRHPNQNYLTCGNKREGAYGCCLDLMTCLAKH